MLRQELTQLLDLSIRVSDDTAKFANPVLDQGNVMVASLIQVRDKLADLFAELRQNSIRLQTSHDESPNPESEEKKENCGEEEVQSYCHGLPRQVDILSQCRVVEYVVLGGLIVLRLVAALTFRLTPGLRIGVSFIVDRFRALGNLVGLPYGAFGLPGLFGEFTADHGLILSNRLFQRGLFAADLTQTDEQRLKVNRLYRHRDPPVSGS